MSVNLVKIAARTAAAGAAVALGLASAPAALAGPSPAVVQVPCSTGALADDIASANSGDTLNLSVLCVYVLTEALPDISTDLTITGGHLATLERSSDAPDFSILAVTDDVNVVINNVNFLWFDETEPLRTFIFQDRVRNYIGADLSTGFEYRPLLSNNVIVTAGVSTLIPGAGFQDLYRRFTDRVNPLLASFLQMELTY